MRESGFLRREVNGVVYYSCAALEQVPGVRHAFSTRHGGVSAFPVNSLNLAGVPWDHPDRVAENRRRFMSATGLGSARLATLAQIHSDRLHILTADGEEEETRAQGDALATSSKGIALAVQTADCLPLLVADPRNLAIAAIHSGWRGTVARICSKTIEGMRANFGSDPDRLIVAMGPGIRACCFEVGSEVVDQFAASFSGINLAKPCVGSPGKHLLDLPGAIDFQLRQAGVDPDNVFDVGICTRCRIDECFSYRGEGPRSGRMMAAIASVEFA